ncbi:MAG: hypothetical protein O9340_12120 [Cyclobacteriaceae bacterium]|jgi:hypothetical protein|nr:hypothetical protein [Cyclobacteriaceae bacterium]
MILELQGLGDKIIPKIYDQKTGKFADPNTSLAHKGKVKWDCNDWVKFHQSLVEAFEKGTFASKIKYKKPEAIKQANKVFSEHFNKHNGWLSLEERCGYSYQFSTYMDSVGLSHFITLPAKAVNATRRTVMKVIDSGEKISAKTADTLVNTVDNTGKAIVNVSEGVSNISNVGKYLVPVAIGGVVLFVGAYVYKNYIKQDKQFAVPTPGGIVKV